MSDADLPREAASGAPRLISMWSGPRTVSTAMMYSWRERPDTEVIDEPWYGLYLLRTGTEHPVAVRVIESQLTTVDGVVEWTRAPGDRPIRFLKNMAHHLQGLELDERRRVLDLSTNFLLVRDPAEMVPSLADRLGRVPTLAQTGLIEQIWMVENAVGAHTDLPVVDGHRLLADPARVLAALCAALGLDFDERMLEWPAGPKPEDGVWAAHWYDRVHRSTRFGSGPASDRHQLGPPQPRSVGSSRRSALESLIERCRPLYERLLVDAI